MQTEEASFEYTKTIYYSYVYINESLNHFFGLRC